MRILTATLAASLFVASAALAQSGTITVENAWSRAAMAGRNGAVFLTIVDKGQADTLVSASSPVAERVEVHESLMDQGVMKMREVKGLTVTPEKPVTLAPGGYHIMLMNLKQPLSEGDKIQVTLNFQKAGAVSTTAVVAKAGAPAPAGQEHKH